ncbi:Zinc finger, SWIM-type [Sesbania bispinosa]|nr:Zinc finger, SWIM-type [Sesbania bispinosa]
MRVPYISVMKKMQVKVSEYACVGMSINDFDDIKKIDMKKISCEEVGKCDFEDWNLDGDMAMRNAIRKVFPDAHHRLCAWHLLRNATTNVVIPSFLEELEKCMFANVEVGEFFCRWTNMVSKFQLEENNWMKELLDKKHIWATAYKIGQFFAGLRTITQCESLHGQLGKFIQSCYNLTEFVQHFQHCLCYIRYKEKEDDFACMLGEAVLRTNLQPLERESAIWSIYTVKRYQSGGKEWFVSLYAPSEEFKCSCQRMKSYGLPCPHIECVLVYPRLWRTSSKFNT